MTVTFDFDNTLTRKHVQDYFKSLVKKGVDVWLLTSRFDELNKHRYHQNPTNDDLWKLIDELKFPRHKVLFTNFELKANYLKETKVLWHLDDDLLELKSINNTTKTTAISVHGNWKHKCNKLLKTNKK